MTLFIYIFYFTLFTWRHTEMFTDRAIRTRDIHFPLFFIDWGILFLRRPILHLGDLYYFEPSFYWMRHHLYYFDSYFLTQRSSLLLVGFKPAYSFKTFPANKFTFIQRRTFVDRSRNELLLFNDTHICYPFNIKFLGLPGLDCQWVEDYSFIDDYSYIKLFPERFSDIKLILIHFKYFHALIVYINNLQIISFNTFDKHILHHVEISKQLLSFVYTKLTNKSSADNVFIPELRVDRFFNLNLKKKIPLELQLLIDNEDRILIIYLKLVDLAFVNVEVKHRTRKVNVLKRGVPCIIYTYMENTLKFAEALEIDIDIDLLEIFKKHLKNFRNNYPDSIDIRDWIIICIRIVKAANDSLITALIKRLQEFDKSLCEIFNPISQSRSELVQYVNNRELIDLYNLRHKQGIARGFNVNKDLISELKQFSVIESSITLKDFRDHYRISPRIRRFDRLNNNSPFYYAIYNIINNPAYPNTYKQLSLEHLALFLERNYVSLILDSNPQHHHPIVSALFNKILPLLVRKIDFMKKQLEEKWDFDSKDNIFYKQHDKGSLINVDIKFIIAVYVIGAENVSSIIISTLIDKIIELGDKAKEVTLIFSIGEKIFKHMKYSRKILNENIIPRWVIKIWSLFRKNITSYNQLDLTAIGQALLDMTLFVCHKIFKTHTFVDKKDKKSIKIIYLTNEYFVYLANFSFNPFRLPMLVRPLLWTFDSLKEEYFGGGYLTPLYNDLANDMGLVHPDHQMRFHFSQISNTQVDAVNYLNGQGFRINTKMLDYLLVEWEKEDSFIFDGYNRPANPDWTRSRIDKHNSVYLLNRNTINLAILYREAEVFYLPVFLDFRGRIYPLVNCLSFQGGDIARSLLLFVDNHANANKAVVDASLHVKNKHILHYFANVFGLDKVSIDKRIEWAEKTLPEMIDIYKQDIETFNIEYVAKAKEKAQFVSTFLAISHSHGDYDSTQTPVLFDATCSGMQHLSALTSDIELATLVNLTGCELQDFYSYCADRVVDHIKSLPDTDVKQALLNIKITRKLIKLPVMTIPYNIGLDKLTDNITDYFSIEWGDVDEDTGKKPVKFKVPSLFSVNGEEFEISGKVAGTLGSIVFHKVNELIPPVKPLKSYFNGMIKLLEKINKPLFWITPAGMKIWGAQFTFVPKKVKTPLLKHSTPITIRLPTSQYDFKTINRCLMANFIHSLDAANIHILIKHILDRGDLNINVYTIHDCFASLNRQMDTMDKLVRTAFSTLYFENNYLKELDRSLISQIKSYDIEIKVDSEGVRWAILEDDTIALPTLPDYKWEQSKLYLKDQIMNSKYFIS